MTARERFARVNAVFHDVCDLQGDELQRALNAACAGDEDLRRDVLRLLAADRPDDFIEPPTPETVDDVVQHFDRREDTLPQEALDIDELLGPYRVVKKIAEGGMGAVYLGSRADRQFEQWVAIKILRRELSSPRAEARMRRERQTLARLQHPYIARLLDGGSTPDGRPYLVMEYIEGLPIDRACEERSLSLEGRLEMFVQVCEAVSHAHRHLVVHRDIKPNNILVTAEGTPHLLDFGIAKLVEVGTGSSPRKDTVLAMTPAFASPEQKRGEPVGTATDVFSLGRLLETLLPDDTHGLRAHELRSIVRLATNEDEEARYVSVDHLAEDVARVRTGLPVRAHGDLALYHVRKYVQRHAIVFGFGLISLATLAITGTLLTNAWRDAEEERRRAVTALAAAERAREDVERARVEATERNAALERERTAADRARELAEEANILAKSAREEASERAELAERMLRRLSSTQRFLKDLFYSPTARGRGPDMLVTEFLVDAVDELRLSPPEDPGAKTDIRRLLAGAFLELGHYDVALRTFDQALDDTRKDFGEASERFPKVLVEYGNALCRAGQLERGIQNLERALGIIDGMDLKQILPVERVRALVSLSVGLTEARQFQRGLDVALQAEALAREHGLRAPALSDALLAAANAAFRLEPHGMRAFEFNERAIESLEAVYGKGHAMTETATINLAHCHLMDGQPARALAIIEPILAGRRLRLPQHHSSLVNPLSLLGIALKDLRRYEESERALREALLIHRQSGRTDHDREVSLLNTLATCLMRSGSVDEAIKLFDQGLAVEEQHYGRMTRSYVATLMNRAVAKNIQGRYREARADFERAHETCLALFGPQDADTIRAVLNQGMMHFRLGELDLGVRMLDAALAARRTFLDEEHESLANTLYSIARAEQDGQHWTYAAACLREAADILKVARPDLVDRIVRCLVELALCREQLGFAEDGERDLLEALGIALATEPLQRDQVQIVLDRLEPLAERLGVEVTRATCARVRAFLESR